MTHGNGNGAALNRVASWGSIVAMALYVLYIGQWVGAADEKFKDAESVEQTQKQIKERLIRVEEGIEDLEESAAREHDAILDAIKELKQKIEELDN